MEKSRSNDSFLNRFSKPGFLLAVFTMIMMMACIDKEGIHLPSIAEIKKTCGNNVSCVIGIREGVKQNAMKFCETFNSDMEEFKKTAPWRQDVNAAFDLPDDEEWHCGESKTGEPGKHEFYTEEK